MRTEAQRSDEAAASFITARLPVVAVPGVPEIRLHKAAPSSGLRELLGDAAGSPYWAYHWGGGLVLARHLLDRPETVAGRRVVDLGCGSGIVAIAAMRAGARAATAVDVDPHAVVATRLNAALNGVAVKALCADWLDGPAPSDTDLLLVGDLFYEAALAARVLAFCDRCREAGIAILVGDPWRAPLPTHRLHAVAEYRMAETGVAKPCAVFELGAFRAPADAGA
jgi:predicted nicotinamide N-methyase